MKSFCLTSLLTLLLNNSNGKVTLINVLNLTDSPSDTSDKNVVEKEDTIIVGVLLPRNVEGNNDVVAKVSSIHFLDLPHVTVNWIKTNINNIEPTYDTCCSVQRAWLRAARRGAGRGGAEPLVLDHPGGGHRLQRHPGSPPRRGDVLQTEAGRLPWSRLSLRPGSSGEVRGFHKSS